MGSGSFSAAEGGRGVLQAIPVVAKGGVHWLLCL